jgi:hypothetical protein
MSMAKGELFTRIWGDIERRYDSIKVTHRHWPEAVE